MSHEIYIALLIGAVLVGILLVFLYFVKVENFHFEVSPWKNNCLRSDAVTQCAKCCPKGFFGQNVNFEYISDTDRLNQCLVNEHPINTPNRINNYEMLSRYENYCGSCQKNDHKNLSGAWDQQPVNEAFCGTCQRNDHKSLDQSWNTQPQYEAFCDSCSM
jgi:hypothetical protein